MRALKIQLPLLKWNQELGGKDYEEVENVKLLWLNFNLFKWSVLMTIKSVQNWRLPKNNINEHYRLELFKSKSPPSTLLILWSTSKFKIHLLPPNQPHNKILQFFPNTSCTGHIQFNLALPPCKQKRFRKFLRHFSFRSKSLLFELE